MKKALKIDVVNMTVTNVTVDTMEDIYSHIGNGCNLFECPVRFDNGDILYCDEEGLLHENLEGCFSFPDWKRPIVGNAIILGSDDEGDSVDCKSTIDAILSKIIFGNKHVAENVRDTLFSYED